MSAKVDVLAVIRKHAESHRALSGSDAYSAQEAPKLEATLSAVADLVAKSQTASVLLRSLIDALGETEFTEGDLEVANELDAALANIGPQS